MAQMAVPAAPTIYTTAKDTTVRPVGISVVADPLQGTLIDIVFIHGLQGHPERTWTYTAADRDKLTNRFGLSWRRDSPSSSSFASADKVPEIAGSAPPLFWPRDLLAADERFDQARVLTCGYDSNALNFFAANNQDNLLGHADTLLMQLQQIRKKNPDRPLIFVVHSLGGIVLKEILDRSRRSTHQPQFLHIYNSTKGIIFLGTPHRGSDGAEWGIIATNFAKLALQGANKKLLKTLKPDNSLLEHLRKVFLEMLEDRKFKIHSFYEQMALTGAPGFQNQLVVSKDSATVGHASAETVAGIDKNHREMCRFSGFGDANYLAVSGAIEDYVNSSGMIQTSQAKTLLRPDAMTDRMSDKDLEEEKQCINSLWYPDIDARALDPALIAEPGTCEWILSHQKIRSWISNKDSDLLFLSGKPGCGKSVATKYLKDNLPTLLNSYVRYTPGTTQISPMVTYFPFNDRDQNAKKFYHMVRSILYQLFTVSPAHFRFSRLLQSYKLLKADDSHGRSFEWPLHLLREAWSLTLRCDTGVPLYVIVDALDEAEIQSAKETLGFLQPRRIGVTSGQRLKVKAFVASRPEMIIRICDDSYRMVPRIRLEDTNEMVNLNDVAIFVQNQIVKVPPHRRREMQPLFGRIVKQANGILLWAKLVVEHIIMQAATDSYEEMYHDIVEIPSEMKDVYRIMLQRASDKKHVDEQRKMLQWVLYATEPLTLSNLQTAILMRANPCNHTDCFSCISKVSNQVSEKEMENRLVTVSGGLLELRKTPDDKLHNPSYSPSTVQLIHQSAKDFLLENPKVWFPEIQESKKLSECSNAFLAACCCWYLNHMIRARESDRPSNRFRGKEHHYESVSFARYAIASWSHHVFHAGPQSRGVWAIFEDVTHNPTAFDAICDGEHVRFTRSKRQHPIPPVTPLMIATYNSLPVFVNNLLETPRHMINHVDGNGRTAISIAAETGDESIFGALLSFNGVDINLADWQSRNPFDWAVRSGHVFIVRLIMDAKEGYIPKDSEYLFSSLCVSAAFGHLHVVQEFLNMNLDWMDIIQRGPLKDPLVLAAGSGHLAVTKLLNSKSPVQLLGPERMERALFAAWTGSHSPQRWELIEYLCSFRIDDKKLLSDIFCSATAYGMIDILKVISANQDVTVNSMTVKGQSPLLFAVEHNQVEAFDYIISAGAEINYSTLKMVIHLSAFVGIQSSYVYMVRSLITNSIDIDLQCRDFEHRTLAELMADTIHLDSTNGKHRELVQVLKGDEALFSQKRHLKKGVLRSYKSRRDLLQPLSFYMN